MHEAFGEKCIVFPNPMYGDWEAALYQYDFKKSDAEKKSSVKRHCVYLKIQNNST